MCCEFTGAFGVVMYICVNNIGDRTPPGGTPVLNWRCFNN